ncbi:MAG: single-stranded DNA-binding protein [Anaerolineaceae bacterium]|nr:single-stranded DNA-binding protein [Anaerolineaceae bacterium]
MYQKIIVVGNLGSDPEMRYMPDGTAVTNFSLATNRRWTDGATGQPRDETTWFRVSVWRKQAEVANQYLSKGRKVLVEGRLRPDPVSGGPRTFTRQDGTVGASYEITADSIQFLGGREEGGGSYEGGGDEYQGAPAAEEDDIPF